MFNKIKLIDEWKHCWKMFSVQAGTLGVAITGAYAALPPNFQSLVPSNVMLGVTGFLFVVGIVGRLVKQEAIPAANSPQKAPDDSQ